VYQHARRHGSDDDYRDPYDVMSMFRAWPGHSPANANIPIGPGLNAAFMKRCGWLDPTRATSTGQVALRPLHRRDLPGPLYIVVGDYYVEYRPAQRWDTGFSRSTVLVHYLANDTSYLIAELHAGDPAFTWGNPLSPFVAHGSIQVDAIDDGAETATVTTTYVAARPVPVAGPVFSLFETEFTGGAGLVIIGGRLVRIPPRSPALRLVEAAAQLASLGEVQVAPRLVTEARAEIYAQTIAELGAAREHITGVSSPFDHINMDDARRFHRREG
jgi:hypothetical protein